MATPAPPPSVIPTRPRSSPTRVPRALGAPLSEPAGLLLFQAAAGLPAPRGGRRCRGGAAGGLLRPPPRRAGRRARTVAPAAARADRRNQFARGNDAGRRAGSEDGVL